MKAHASTTCEAARLVQFEQLRQANESGVARMLVPKMVKNGYNSFLYVVLLLLVRSQNVPQTIEGE
jgi:hypothetical protein